MSDETALSVAVLAGGQSRRMGQDKALLEVGGRALIEYVLEAAAPFANETLIIATERPEYDRFGCRVVPDKFPHSGSLGGIYTALSEASQDHCLVLACDMPFINRELLQFMVSEDRNYDVLVPALSAERSDQGGGETLETLHAIYSRTCMPAIERQLNAGVFKVIGFFSEVHVEKIPEEKILQYDPHLLSFFNTNTPEEFDWAKERLAGASK
jgi:molybdopterin-guanine dinucleotide biosynthesis protein A